MLKLQFKDQRRAAIWLVDPRYSLGKDPSNDIVLDEDGVSGFHAELRVEGENVFLTDAGSIGGTFLNGDKLSQRQQLGAGDIIKIASVELELVDPKQALKQVGDDSGATAISPALSALQATQGAASTAAPVTAADSGWLLRAKTGSAAGKEFPIPGGRAVTLGRSNKCDIVLPGSHVSRVHAEMDVRVGEIYVKDLGSSNGTYVNRKRITEATLKPGDEIRFDTISFEVVGPVQENDEDEVDRTLFRSVSSADVETALAEAEKKKTATRQATPKTQPAAAVAEKPVEVPVANEKSGGGKIILLLGALALIGAGVAAYMLL